jgi:hypothetical protein
MRPLPALAVLLSYALSAAATGSPAGKTQRTCKVQFGGDAFLATASQRGLEPERKTACERVSISDNAFYAMPLSACDIVFKNATWLTKNARFQSLRGNGGFTAHATKDGLEVRIKPAGGFYLYQVTIAVTGTFASCKEIMIEDVLGDG